MRYRIPMQTEVGLWTRQAIDARHNAPRMKMQQGRTIGKRMTDREVIFDETDLIPANYIKNAALNSQMFQWFQLPRAQHGADVISVPLRMVYAE